jgi:hypothetical protein
MRTGNDPKPISLEEWLSVTSRYPSFVITNELKQQNPFTQQFLMMNLAGSGYGKPLAADPVGWPHDGTVWFRHTGKVVDFIQYTNAKNPELQKLADDLGGVVASVGAATLR